MNKRELWSEACRIWGKEHASLLIKVIDARLEKRRKQEQVLEQAQSEDFEKWWEQYPKKQAKPEARKAWAKVDFTLTTLDKMLDTLRLQNKEWTDKKYIPLPTTYLNQGRYMDEVKEVVKKKDNCNCIYCGKPASSMEHGLGWYHIECKREAQGT